MQIQRTIVGRLVLAFLLLTGHAWAQAPAASMVRTPAAGQIDFALGYSADPNNLTNGTKILLQGGSAELVGHLPHGFAGVASETGLHTGAASAGVPQNLVIAVFGPRYTFGVPAKRTSVFIQGLVGEANGFNGVFPGKSGADESANGLALKLGGGVDIGLRPHLSLRLVQVDFLQTQLPNGTTNVQRSVLVGAGIVWHSARQ